MATRKNTAPKARVSRSVDLSEILGQFSDSRAILECAYTVLDCNAAGNEAVCLRHGLDMLSAAYNDLDKAIMVIGDGDA
jgi:hypothetical protein